VNFHHHQAMATEAVSSASRLEALLWGDWVDYTTDATDEDRAALKAARVKARELRDACEALKVIVWKSLPRAE
jgi:hypothetical protein